MYQHISIHTEGTPFRPKLKLSPNPDVPYAQIEVRDAMAGCDLMIFFKDVFEVRQFALDILGQIEHYEDEANGRLPVPQGAANG